MSWRDTKARAPVAGAAITRRGFLMAAAMAPLLAGCGFQPLYGPSFSGGTRVADELAAVDVALLPGRVGQQVRNEIIFKTTGGRSAPSPKYRLEIALRESAQSLLVQTNGDSTGLMFGLDADFKLFRSEDNSLLLDSKATARAAYQKVPSVFANIRARRDAEDRAARMLADSIRTQVAAFVSQAA